MIMFKRHTLSRFSVVRVGALIAIFSAFVMATAAGNLTGIVGIDSVAGFLGLEISAMAAPNPSFDNFAVKAPAAVFSGAPNDHTVLILDTSVSGGASSQEANEARAKGMTVEVVNAATWGAKTAAEFATYRALILGEPTCGSIGSVTAAAANGSVWGPIVNGNVIINGSDPVFHSGSHAGAVTLTKNSVDFAIEKVGKTGAYISLSCYYHDASPGTPVSLLNNAFGLSFAVRATNGDNIHVTATSPALAGLTDASLSNWGNSTHEAFDSFPVDFAPLAVAVGFGSYVSPDGTVGNPYIIARGVTVLSNISLTDDGHDSHFLGQNHTFTATVTTDTPSRDTPVV